MLRWLRSLVAWQTVSDTGVWLYQQNAVTGSRRALRQIQTAWQPLDRPWLAGVGDKPDFWSLRR